jgi:hypothetical protein
VIGNTNITGEEACKMGFTLAPIAVGPCNDAWVKIFGKYNNLGKINIFIMPNDNMAVA